MDFFSGLPYWPRVYLLAGAVAFAISAALMPVLIWVLRHFNVVDEVHASKIHRAPTPRGGGIVIFLAFAIAVVIPYYFDYPMQGVIIGAFACLVVGALDDIRGGVPAILKLATLIVLTLVLSRYGVVLKVFPWTWLNIAVTMLWIVGVTSAFNGLDNMDGLAGGIAAIVAAMFLIIAVQTFLAVGTENAVSWFGLLAAGLIGANLGFLVYNFGPARIFMGDAGSFFLGFTLAAMSVMGEWAESPVIAATIPVLILGVPIFDFAYILIARIWRGETRNIRAIVEHCAPDHLSHRLCWIGFSQHQSVLICYLIALDLGFTGVLLRNSSSSADSVLALLQGGGVVLLVIVLMAAASSRHTQYIQREVERLREEAVHEAEERQIPLPLGEKTADKP